MTGETIIQEMFIQDLIQDVSKGGSVSTAVDTLLPESSKFDQHKVAIAGGAFGGVLGAGIEIGKAHRKNKQLPDGQKKSLVKAGLKGAVLGGVTGGLAGGQADQTRALRKRWDEMDRRREEIFRKKPE